MFLTNSEEADGMNGGDDGGQKSRHRISHPTDMVWFYAREQTAPRHFLANPTSQMIMSSSIQELDPTLSGKNKGRSIKKIQLITNAASESPFTPDTQVGLVTRITRFSDGSRDGVRYLVESTDGIVLEGPFDGAWSRCKQEVLMDVHAPMQAAQSDDGAPAVDVNRVRRGVQRKVVIQAIDLFQDDAETVHQWLTRESPDLGGKAPKDLTTEEDYLLLIAFIDRIKHQAFN